MPLPICPGQFSTAVGGASINTRETFPCQVRPLAQELAQIKQAGVRIWPIGNVWKFTTDPDNVGVAEEWFAESFNDTAWAEVRSDLGRKGWESQGFPGYIGFGWYRQKFPAPADLGDGHVYLFF